MKEFSHPSILLVDDDPGMLRALEKVLRRDGFRVTPATWVRDGIQELMDADQHFDLVITDLRMPMASGLMIMHAVRTAWSDVPVIIITAYGNPELTPEWWQEQGASAYLEKPIEAHRLLETVRDVLRHAPATSKAG